MGSVPDGAAGVLAGGAAGGLAGGRAPARRGRRLAALGAAQPPLALYEPHTHVAHVPEPTQPTRAWVSKLSDVPALDERTRAVQGPARVGPRAWALYTEQVDVGLD